MPTTDNARLAMLAEAFTDACRGEVAVDDLSRAVYASDASHYQTMPQIVVCPQDAADCVAALRLAHRHGLAVTPRAAGTSLSGQTFGPGLVLDCSRHMDQLLECNEAEGWARVQPGVIVDRLNWQLEPTGWMYAPDPATSSRACIGGVIGNNSSGMRSILHGKAIDHVLELTVALDDGSVLTLDACDDRDEWRRREERPGREGQLYRAVRQVIEANEAEIRERYPAVMRRVAGYNLDEFVDGAGYCGDIGPRAAHNQGRRIWNLANLVVGSEGTLCTVLEAKVRLVRAPGATALCVVSFDSDIEALRSVPPIVAHGPSAVELLDRCILQEARRNAATKELMQVIDAGSSGNQDGVLIVEVCADTQAEADARIAAIAGDLQLKGIGVAWGLRCHPAEQARVWQVRKLGLGLITNVPGPQKGQACVEDACVPIEQLADYIEGLCHYCDEKNVPHAMYAHASVGVIHLRPMLDLHLPAHQRLMEDITSEACRRALALGGTFAGEHGDGIVRGQFLREAYGETLIGAFRQIKAAWDPNGRMNPGKIVDPPSMIDPDHLRYGPHYQQAEVASRFHYRKQGGLQLAIEQCNGVGACRKIDLATMCPSYMATRDERHSTRGRANALRMAISGQLDLPAEEALASDELKEVLDLCLACKACATECPNEVDMARLKAEVLQRHHDKHGASIGTLTVGNLPDNAALIAGPLAAVPNALRHNKAYRWVLEKVTGFDRRRVLPAFATKPLAKHLKGRAPKTDAPRGKVVLFDDTYANYFDPQIGVSAVDLLEGCGYQVIIAKAGCCQRPRLSKGLVDAAKKHGTKTMQKLDVYARQGLPILCLEPSCASSLREDLPDLIDDAELAARVAAQIEMIDVFLAREGIELTSEASDVLLHGHCHQKSCFGTKAIQRGFEAEGTRYEEVDSGCCGMAGAFGYEHHDLSMQIGESRLFPAVREAHERGATIIACGTSCRHQLHDALGIEAKHWVELVKPKATTET